MTKTALRALTVVAAASAIVLTTSPAWADPASDPCFRTDPECYEQPTDGEQLPEEVIGSYRCPEPTDVVLALTPDGGYVCGPVPGSTPTPPAPAPAPDPAPDPGVEPAHIEGQPVDTSPSPSPSPRSAATAPSTAAAPAQSVFTMEQILEWMRDMLPWLFVPAQRA